MQRRMRTKGGHIPLYVSFETMMVMKRQDNNTSMRPTVDRRLGDLLVVMERLEGLYLELRQELSNKLEHMRRADHDGMAVSVEREQALVTRINEQEGLRKQVMEQVGRGYGLAPATIRAMPVRRLAERVIEPYRTRLFELADRLKAVVADVKKANGLINRVSQDVLTHVREIFSVITAAEPASEYSCSGRTVESKPREMFSTIG